MGNTIYIFPSSGDGDFLAARICAHAHHSVSNNPAIILVGDEWNTLRNSGATQRRVTAELLTTFPQSKPWVQAAPLAAARLYLLGSDLEADEFIRELDSIRRAENSEILDFVTLGGPFRTVSGDLSWFPPGPARASRLMRHALEKMQGRSRLSILGPGAASDLSPGEVAEAVYSNFSEVTVPEAKPTTWNLWAINYCSDAIAVALAAIHGYRGLIETAPSGENIEACEWTGKVFTVDVDNAWTAEATLNRMLARSPVEPLIDDNRKHAYTWNRLHQLQYGGMGIIDPDRDWRGIQKYASPDIFPVYIP
jgi:hypothetical protein